MVRELVQWFRINFSLNSSNMERTCIIIVFFNPTNAQIDRAKILSKSKHVIVVDNSNGELRVFAGAEKITYIPLHQNMGIAHAQNVGIVKAQEFKADYLVFLDQDSKLTGADIDKLQEVFVKVRQEDSQAIAIGPLIINSETDKEYKTIQRQGVSFVVDSIISSGTLVKASMFSVVGMMEERLFIDLVDHEWCWRCASHGYHVYMTREVVLNHKVGNKSFNWGGIQIIASAPFRYYYKYRNALILMRRGYVPRKWKLKTMLRIFFEYFLFLFTCLFVKENMSRLGYATKGLKDGIL